MMRSILPLALLVLAGAALAAPVSSPGPTAAASSRSAVATACERSAQDTLRDTRGPTAVATFAAAPSLQPGAADAAEITLRGAGQVRAPNGTYPFSYSCTYDTVAGSVSGVVVRDAGAPAKTPATAATEPDLSHVSPLACESAAAGALKRRWPNVSAISFTAVTRQFSQNAGDHANLRGQGTALPSVHERSTHFSYNCTIDPRNGQVMTLQIGD